MTPHTSTGRRCGPGPEAGALRSRRRYEPGASWRHPNCFRALPLGSAELLRFGEIFRRVAKLFLAGLDCAPRFVVPLVDTRASSLQCTQIKNYPCSTPVSLCHNQL